MKRILLSPITHANLMLVGILIFIGVLHEQTHQRIDADVHGYVKAFCRANEELCESYISDY